MNGVQLVEMLRRNTKSSISLPYSASAQILKAGFLFGKELFIRFTASAFRKLLSVYVFSYFPLGLKGRMWDLIVPVPDHYLSFYFAYQSSCSCAMWWP